MKAYPANVKNLIRLVKYWKKETISSNSGERIPTSYPIELITIHLWEQHTTTNGTFNTLKAFHGVMEALKDYKTLNVIWTKNYHRYIIPDDIRTKRYDFLQMSARKIMRGQCNHLQIIIRSRLEF